LYDDLSALVFGLALRTTRSRVLAEEVVQEVFVQVWSQASRFDPSRGSARSWVATIAHRRAVDVVRKMQASSDREGVMPVDGPALDVADIVVEGDEQDRVRDALGALTDLQREAIEMAYFGGLTYRQVADRLEAPLGTVKTRMRDGLARIRTAMEPAGD
jgi:RNA polymerase sigma-70 factor, ECF subfamily